MTGIRIWSIGIALGILWAAASSSLAQQPERLDEQLAAVPASDLASEARRFGDPERGALLFYRPELNCARCHESQVGDRRLAPDLAQLGAIDGDLGAHLVQSVLRPSEAIRQGFESAIVVDRDGKTRTGLVLEKSESHVVLADPAGAGEPMRYALDEVDEWRVASESAMPAGLINLLAGKSEFLDLAAYLLAVAEGGARRALELRPHPSLIDLPPVAEYESRVDHAGLIRGWDEASLARGGEIYDLRCASCHGTVAAEGSLPTSLRFARGQFKHGADPYTMYGTLTHGFGMMVRQTWMVPQQKYDVIHYIREHFLREHNPTQYAAVTPEYLAALPPGDTFGPQPVLDQPWRTMDYGRTMMTTIEVGEDGRNVAYKGIAVRLDPGPGGVAEGSHWILYDHDTLRVAAIWSAEPESDERFIDWRGVHFDGRHGIHPRIVGDVLLENGIGPGWSRPGTVDDFSDVERVEGRDGRRYGPLPRSWAQYRGRFDFGDKTVLHYTVGGTNVWELPGMRAIDLHPVFTRTLYVDPHSEPLVLQVAQVDPGATVREESFGADSRVMHVTSGDPQHAERLSIHVLSDGNAPEFRATPEGVRLEIPPGDRGQLLRLSFLRQAMDQTGGSDVKLLAVDHLLDPRLLIRGGPGRWPEIPTTTVIRGDDQTALAVDDLVRPDPNPWRARVRLSGVDLCEDGQTAAVCSWDGSVFLVRGIQSADGVLSWRRIAAGLFQPLGIKLVDGKICVTCRDQLVRLHDLNGDDEIDWYECINNDHQVTDHFHEFAMGLQTDADGNFYYAKSARHALPALVPHHGTLLKVSADGQTTEILANGFRAANGVCLNDDGSFFVTDQEGHWTPKNRINRVVPGGFYGNMMGYHDERDSADAAMEQPLVWITNAMDRSPGELMWVRSEKWGPLNGRLLNLSYGTGQIFLVPHEVVDGQWQGGVVALPIPLLPTGVMRGRFHPDDGQLYACGMFAWSSNREQPGGFYRIRATGKPVHLPLAIRTGPAQIQLEFSAPLQASSVENVENWALKAWSLRRSADYGSPHLNEQPWTVAAVRLSDNSCNVLLEIPELAPTPCLEIRYSLQAADGQTVRGTVHNTIHRIGAAE